jgi:hypothetical protein
MASDTSRSPLGSSRPRSGFPKTQGAPQDPVLLDEALAKLAKLSEFVASVELRRLFALLARAIMLHFTRGGDKMANDVTGRAVRNVLSFRFLIAEILIR